MQIGETFTINSIEGQIIVEDLLFLHSQNS